MAQVSTFGRGSANKQRQRVYPAEGGLGASVGVVVGLGVNVGEGQGRGHGRGRGQGQASAWVVVWPRALMGVGKGLARGVGVG